MSIVTKVTDTCQRLFRSKEKTFLEVTPTVKFSLDLFCGKTCFRIHLIHSSEKVIAVMIDHKCCSKWIEVVFVGIVLTEPVSEGDQVVLIVLPLAFFLGSKIGRFLFRQLGVKSHLLGTDRPWQTT